MRPTRHQQRGQALVLIALAIVGMIGLVALAIDGGSVFSDRRHAQNAADTAAMAAALAKASSQDWSSAGFTRAASNGYDNDGIMNTVAVVNPPASGCKGSGPYVGNEEYVQVVIHSTVDTTFARVVGIDQLYNCVEAIARAKPSVTEPLFFGNAMVSLSPHDCSALWVHGNSQTDVVGSGVYVNSDCSTAMNAFRQQGSSGLNSPSVCVVGGATYTDGSVIPPPTTGCEPISYPPSLIWPQPTCPTEAIQSGDTLSAGFVNGDFPPSGVKNLQSGTYCINGGDFVMNAGDTLANDPGGVLIYVMTGGVHLNGGAQLNISSQTTGDFAGLLLYLPPDNHSVVILNGTADSQFTGTILAPGSEIQVNGTTGAYGFHSQVIGYTIDLSGTGDALIVYNDNENYDGTIPPMLALVK